MMNGLTLIWNKIDKFYEDLQIMKVNVVNLGPVGTGRGGGLPPFLAD
jgi:hypothetical protein